MFWNLPAPPWFPIYLSLKVAGLATLMALITGVAVARYQMRKKTMRSKVLDALCTLPMILPPTVLGYYLILIIGRRGVLGHWLQAGRRCGGDRCRLSSHLQVGARGPRVRGSAL